MDTLQVALLTCFVVGLVAIPILYWLFGRVEAGSNHNRVRSADKGAARERRVETSDLGQSDQVHPKTS